MSNGPGGTQRIGIRRNETCCFTSTAKRSLHWHADVRDHLDGCWSCSLKRDQLAGAIAAFMRERETGLGAEDLSETADRRFESRMRRLRSKPSYARLIPAQPA